MTKPTGLHVYISQKYILDGQKILDCRIIVYLRQGEEKVCLKMFRMKRGDKARPYETVTNDAENYANGIGQFLKVLIDKKSEQVEKIK